MSKVILVTGASSGIGKSIAQFLHKKKGYKVYGTSRTPEKYIDLEFPLLAMDVTNLQTIKSCVDNLILESGRIDVLINNAGVGITGPVEEIAEKEIKAHFDTNFFGPINVAKAVIPQMRQQNSGLIINVTSIAGYMGLPYRGVYSASKAALEVLTEAFRMELKPFNIKMTNIAPGDFSTNIASRRYHSPVLDHSPYKKSYGLTLQLMDNHVNSGQDPLKMAIAVHQIITSKEPKIHYKVGSFFQKFSIVLKRLLPDFVFEKLLMNHYRL